MWNSAYTQKRIISASIKTLPFTFISCKVVYLLRSITHIKYTVAPLGNKVPLPLNVPYRRQ